MSSYYTHEKVSRFLVYICNTVITVYLERCTLYKKRMLFRVVCFYRYVTYYQVVHKRTINCYITK